MPVNLPLILDGERLALLCVRAGCEAYHERGATRPCSLLGRVPVSWTRELHVVTEGSFLPAYYVRGKAGIPHYWLPLFQATDETAESLRCAVAKWNTDLMNYFGVVPDEDFAAVMEMCS